MITRSMAARLAAMNADTLPARPSSPIIQEEDDDDMIIVDEHDEDETQKFRASLETLPSELLGEILSYLSPLDLVALSGTCRVLYTHATSDTHWARILRQVGVKDLPMFAPPTRSIARTLSSDSFLSDVPDPSSTIHSRAPSGVATPSLCYGNTVCPPTITSYRELYASQYPYWFIPEHKIWFADKAVVGQEASGQLMLAKYDQTTGTIEGLRMVAQYDQTRQPESWEWNREVSIHSFKPKVVLVRETPILTLRVDNHMTIEELEGTDKAGFVPTPQKQSLLGRLPIWGNPPPPPTPQKATRYNKERMASEHLQYTSSSPRLSIFPAISIPYERQHSSQALWPPSTLSHRGSRVRNSSNTGFSGLSQKPQSPSEMSRRAFRLRKWMHFRTGTMTAWGPDGRRQFFDKRLGETVMTFATLDSKIYTPSLEKPYQGVWVGDYSSHGCEFLCISQYTPSEVAKLKLSTPDPILARHEDFDYGPFVDPPSLDATDAEDAPGQCGRLEAVKLTGDPNVPRGETTFVAEEIGLKGTMRICEEARFRGARMVRSWGHIAAPYARVGNQLARAFDGFIPSQLILVDENTLCQYWMEFGHVCYYRRVDVDELLDKGEYQT